jgi:hypothetical protein
MRRVVFALLIAMLGCADGPAAIQDQAGSEVASLGVREVLSGSVGIQMRDDDVVVWLDEGRPSRPRDGVADRVFVLQRQGPIEPVAERALDIGHLSVTESQVEVRAADGTPILRLLRQRDASRQTALTDREAGWPTVVGFGLSRRTGAWALSDGGLADDQLRDVAAGCGAGRRGDGDLALPFAHCWSGGAGAQTCSTGCIGGKSCSVGCSTGFYACCDDSRCRCTCVAADKLPVTT